MTVTKKRIVVFDRFQIRKAIGKGLSIGKGESSTTLFQGCRIPCFLGSGVFFYRGERTSFASEKFLFAQAGLESGEKE